uniref:Uncharacterized protein n=1 Tax=Pseudictyota dubia TaxID=2749911 RepID=A0A7R9VMT4_9STRA|mmetsp:Transcript_17990/g.33532  ORF Transcript_17990/g.33532 Transcript_17990/m.33532 type:complete len:104 (+) Transcript_17990:103-414(+)
MKFSTTVVALLGMASTAMAGKGGCSWDPYCGKVFKYPANWCAYSEDRCEDDCDGTWLKKGKNKKLPGCCTDYDDKAKDSCWCHISEDNCESCSGHWEKGSECY